MQSDLREALNAGHISPSELGEAVRTARGWEADDLVAALDRDLSLALGRETDPKKHAELRRAVELVRATAHKTAIEIIAKTLAELTARGLGL